MKFPNGYGSVYKLSGKRRHPWAARKTVGWNDKGQPMYLYVGYYSTRSEALNALARYNDHPFEKGSDQYTLAEIYEKWSAKKYEEVSHSNVVGYRAAWKLAEPIKDMKMDEIKLDHLEDVCEQSGKNAPTLKKFKILLNQLFDYAVKHEYIISSRRDVVSFLDISKYGNPNKYDRTPFSSDEIVALKATDQNEWIMIVLILIYTGVRIGELLDLKVKDIHMDERWFYVRQSKTDAGIREVPIAEKIVPYMNHWIQKEYDYLICTPDRQRMTYDNFYVQYWKKLVPNHKPHDTRHTCVSLLTAAGVDPRIIRSIVGHKGVGVTEAVYTHLDMAAKLEAINKICH